MINLSPKVSVIVPVYNTQEYLVECLDSLRSQTYTNFEALAINDGSTDDSLSILNKFSSLDSRFTVLDKPNGGLSSARNCGLKLVTGEYIAFLDSDDYYHPEFLFNHIDCLLSYRVPVSICGRKLVWNNQIEDIYVHDSKRVWSSSESVVRLLNWDDIDGAVWDKVFHSSLFANIRFREGCLSEDLPVTAQILVDSSFVVHIGKPLYYYRQRKNSITKMSISDKSLSIISSAKLAAQIISSRYPSTRDLCDSYVAYHYLTLFRILFGSPPATIEYFSIFSYLRKSLQLNSCKYQSCSRSSPVLRLLVWLSLLLGWPVVFIAFIFYSFKTINLGASLFEARNKRRLC